MIFPGPTMWSQTPANNGSNNRIKRDIHYVNNITQC